MDLKALLEHCINLLNGTDSFGPLMSFGIFQDLHDIV